MTNERLAELKADAEKCIQQGEGYHPNVGAKELLALVELGEAMLERRKKIREQVATLRAKKSGKPVKAAQEGRKRAKKASGAEVPESADTVEAVAEKLDRLKASKVVPGAEEGQKILKAEFVSPVAPAARKPIIPTESALPECYRSVLDRVKLPSQIKFDPTAVQVKPTKKK